MKPFRHCSDRLCKVTFPLSRDDFAVGMARTTWADIPDDFLFCQMDIADHCVITPVSYPVGQVLPPRPPRPSLAFPRGSGAVSLSSSVAFWNARQGRLCPSSSPPQSADGLSSPPGLSVLPSDGKGLWSSALSVTAWASVSHTPLPSCCLSLKTYCQGGVDSTVHPAEEPLFVVV